MSSWLKCPCGHSIHTNPFAGTSVYRLILDADYDSATQQPSLETLESLFFEKGVPVYRCSHCGRIAIDWGRNADCAFYRPEAVVGSNPLGESDDERRLEALVALAEEAYDALYDSPGSATARYSDVKEAFYDAIRLAREIGKEEEAKRLSERLAHIKEVFRRQFV